MAVVPQVGRRSAAFNTRAVQSLAIALSVVGSLFLLGTALVPRQYSTPLTSAPLSAEFAKFKTLTEDAIEAACASAQLVVLSPSDVVSLDLADRLQRLPCTVVRPTVVTPLRNASGGGVFVVETSFATGRPGVNRLAEIARSQARAVGITARLQPTGESATEHFVVSEYQW